MTGSCLSPGRTVPLPLLLQPLAMASRRAHHARKRGVGGPVVGDAARGGVPLQSE